MNRYRLLACLALFCSLALAPPGVQAQTCDPRQNAPNYTAGSPSPLVCDLHGSQNVVLKNAAGATIDNLGTGTANASAPSLVEGQGTAFSFDLSGNARITPGTYQSGEDPTATGGGSTNGVMVTENRYLYKSIVVADAQVKASAGFLHCVWISQADAAPTAGDIKIFDNTAESGTVVFHWNLTTAVFTPISFCPDIVMATGIYIGFTTTGDVNVAVSYR